jgi:uncharacterized protein (DUF433 family)
MGALIAAFSEEQAARLTRVTVSQLRYWDKTHFFSPTFPSDATVGRVYAFHDILSLRVLNALRNQFGVPLPHLRAVKERLAHLAEDRWTGTKLWVLNKKVVWQDPHTAQPQEVLSGQYVVPVDLGVVLEDTVRDVREMNRRSTEDVGHVAKSRFVSHNEPVIAGTRIRVRAIKRFHEAGYTVDQIMQEYPDLTEEDVRAALEYAPIRAAA